MVISRSTPIGGETSRRRRCAAMTSPVFSTISRGSSGLPVAWAGHTDVQRPHIVQASVSSSCFQVKSSTTEAPKRLELGLHQVRHRLHGALGPVPVLQVHVQRRREHVAQHRDRQDRRGRRRTPTTWTIHMTWCQSSERADRPAVDQRRRAGSRRSDHFSNVGRAHRRRCGTSR